MIAGQTKGQPATRRLSVAVFSTLLVLTLVVMALLAVSLTAIYFTTYEEDAEQSLMEEATGAAQRLAGLDTATRIELLAAQVSDGVRFTLLDVQGSVLFDSASSDAGVASAPGDHADRPEVRDALESGSSRVSRYSQTLHSDTIYVAVRLDDGQVIRLSETRASLFSFAQPLALPMVALLLVVGVLTALVARVLTRRIMRPLDSLDVSDPLSGRPYAEMLPVLQRIGAQQQLLREQNARLQQADGLRREFSANVSHEMKTPLQVISGYAELMAAGNVEAERNREFAGLIYKEAQSMQRLIDDVLVLSRLDEPLQHELVAQPVDVLESAQRAADHLASLAQARDVTLRVRGSHVRVNGFPALIDQLMGNLLGNAIRYNHVGGTATVEVEQSGDDAVIRVRDTGIGIPPDEREKIFERFYRVDKSRSRETGGTGLGLAIVKHAVMQHDGTIEVESVEGEGTCFTVRLPIA